MKEETFFKNLNLYALFSELPEKVTCGNPKCKKEEKTYWYNYTIDFSKEGQELNKEIELHHYCNECGFSTYFKVKLITKVEFKGISRITDF